MRLISFLGTNDYKTTNYSFEGAELETKYLIHALAKATQPSELHVIATREAWDTHGKELTQLAISEELPGPQWICVPTGGEPHQLWEMFSKIVGSVYTSQSPVLMDITHGFRSQPFFAAACIQYVQSVLPKTTAIRVVYGEFRGTGETSPIWELTPFLDVLAWSRSLMMFLRTGSADDVVAPTESLGRELNKQWAMAGREGSQPQLAGLASAIEAFSDDFTTVRTGSLLTGSPSSAERLSGAIQATQREVKEQLPALAFVLDQVAEMVQPLRCDGARLSSPAGQRALIALAKLYQDMGRYSEACSIIREGWITLGAPENADQPGAEVFDSISRAEQEHLWNSTEVAARTVSEMRNDIQHAGFRKQPHKREWFEKQMSVLRSAWETAVDQVHSI